MIIALVLVRIANAKLREKGNGTLRGTPSIFYVEDYFKTVFKKIAIAASDHHF